MPLKRKKDHSRARRIIIAVVVIAVAVLMIISFPPVQNLTEVVLNP